MLAGPDVLVLAGAGFALYYLSHGSTWPLLSAVLHTRVDAAHRATAVSAMSLAMALGGIVGNLAVPAARGRGEHRRRLRRGRRRRPARGGGLPAAAADDGRRGGRGEAAPLGAV